MNILFLQTPPATNVVEAPSWGKAFGGLIGTMGVVWIIAIMVIILILSRWNNRLEIKGVDRAVVIARSAVSMLMWFVIVPLVIFVLVNAFAIINGLGAINIMFLFNWITLTFSSYGWLIQCAIGSESVQGEIVNYSPDAVVRLVWVFLPLTFIWLRSVKTSWLKWAILPLIIASLVITRHKKAGTTFVTEQIGIENLKKMPIVGSLFAENKPTINGQPAPNGGFDPAVRKVLASSATGLMVIGFVVALYFKKRAIGLIVVMVGLGGFLFITPSVDKSLKKILQGKDHAINLNIDSMVLKLHEYKADSKELELYNTAQQLNQAYKAQAEFVKFPDSLCIFYKDYFYDRCQ